MVQTSLFIGLGLWLLIVTVFTVWLFMFFRRLTNKVEEGNLVSVLKKVLEQELGNSKDIIVLRKEIQRIDNESLKHIQKIGLVKFNPFEEMGGDHSFSLALIDGERSGFVITGLHTRERTRVYIKNIKRGKSEHELSKEEEKALLQACKTTLLKTPLPKNENLSHLSSGLQSVLVANKGGAKMQNSKKQTLENISNKV